MSAPSPCCSYASLPEVADWEIDDEESWDPSTALHIFPDHDGIPRPA
jgi:hypothetical protein